MSQFGNGAVSLGFQEPIVFIEDVGGFLVVLNLFATGLNITDGFIHILDFVIDAEELSPEFFVATRVQRASIGAVLGDGGFKVRLGINEIVVFLAEIGEGLLLFGELVNNL